MTLDEAIKRFESVKLYKNFEEYIKDCGDSRVKDGVKICVDHVNSLLFRGYGICDEDHCPYYKKCVERAEEHRQLAEWLRELKRLKEQELNLDKIKAEIEELDKYYEIDYFSENTDAMYKCNEVLQIIDKYKAESEG